MKTIVMKIKLILASFGVVVLLILLSVGIGVFLIVNSILIAIVGTILILAKGRSKRTN